MEHTEYQKWVKELEALWQNPIFKTSSSDWVGIYSTVKFLCLVGVHEGKGVHEDLIIHEGKIVHEDKIVHERKKI